MEDSFNRTQILADEYSKVAEQVRTMMVAGERLIALGSASFTLLIPIAVAQGNPVVLLLSPLFMVVSIVYTARIYREVLALAGYRYRLERVLNGDCADGPKLFFESEIGAAILQDSRLTYASNMVYGVLCISSVGVGIGAVLWLDQHALVPSYTPAGYIALIAALTVVSAWIVAKTRGIAALAAASFGPDGGEPTE